MGVAVAMVDSTTVNMVIDNMVSITLTAFTFSGFFCPLFLLKKTVKVLNA